jgi:HTH-type transcriptional regulator/antitoxin HigA
MDIRPIRTDEDHRAALAAIDACWGAPEGTEEGDKLDVLLALVEIYEAKRWPMEVSARF